MLFFYRIGFSITSAVAKNQTERLGLNAKLISVQLSCEIIIKINLPEQSTDFFLETDITIPRLSDIQKIIDTSQWINPKVGVLQFINHILEIFHRPEMWLLFYYSVLAETMNIFEMFNGLDIKNLKTLFYGNFKTSFYEKALKMFALQSEAICLDESPFNDPKQIHSIACQNHRYATVGWKMTINDLWAFNPKSQIMRASLTNVNLFLKHWIYGSNRRLEFSRFYRERHHFSNDDCLKIIFKNVDYCIAPVEREMSIQEPGEWKKSAYGGFDIVRIDGRKATIFVDQSMSEMMVWSSNQILK